MSCYFLGFYYISAFILSVTLLVEFVVNVLFDAVLVRIERYGKFAEKQLLRTFHETLVNLPEALVVSEGIICCASVISSFPFSIE